MVRNNFNKMVFSMRLVNIVSIVTALLFTVNCGGDYRPEATGTLGEAVVVMDSTQLESETADAIREVFGRGIETLPSWEPIMDLRFRDFKNNNELEKRRKYKNLIIAAPINDSTNTAEWVRALLSERVEESVKTGNNFAFPLKNEWYKNQWTMILTSTSDSALARKIRQSKETLSDQLLQTELQRWNEEVYDKGEQTDVSDSLWANHGWKIRVQHDWRKNIDTTYTQNGIENHIITMRRPLPDNDRWFWAWWTDNASNIDSISSEWINNKRDAIMEQWIRGSRDSSFVTTEYRRPVLTDSIQIDGRTSFETLGTWQMKNDAMGGPFANLTVHDKRNDRLFILEFGQFAPRYDKRRFVRQFRTMLRTFQSDSSWSSMNNNTVANRE